MVMGSLIYRKSKCEFKLRVNVLRSSSSANINKLKLKPHSVACSLFDSRSSSLRQFSPHWEPAHERLPGESLLAVVKIDVNQKAHFPRHHSTHLRLCSQHWHLPCGWRCCKTGHWGSRQHDWCLWIAGQDSRQCGWCLWIVGRVAVPNLRCVDWCAREGNPFRSGQALDRLQWPPCTSCCSVCPLTSAKSGISFWLPDWAWHGRCKPLCLRRLARKIRPWSRWPYWGWWEVRSKFPQRRSAKRWKCHPNSSWSCQLQFQNLPKPVCTSLSGSFRSRWNLNKLSYLSFGLRSRREASKPIRWRIA